MLIETNFDGEFGWELLKAVPYAYSRYLKGQLAKSVSCTDTKCLYYFSKNHEERHRKRSKNDGEHWDCLLPFDTIHRKEKPDPCHWIPPPYKNFFKGRLAQDRPTVVISNKYNEEWGEPPINFIPTDDIVKMVRGLKNRFKVYYNRPTKLITDNSDIFDLNEKEAVKDAGAILLEEEYESHKSQLSFNTFQMCVFANCDKFVSVQGGTSILSSYFGGINLILAKRGHELGCRSYSWYPALSGCRIKVFGKNESIVKNAVSL